MAASSTAIAVLVLLDRAVFTTDVFVFSLEVIRVARGTERRILVPRKRNIFVIVCVTGAATDVATMIARIIAVRGVRIVNRRPTLRRVTGVAVRDGHKVVIRALRRAAGRDSAVMA